MKTGTSYGTHWRDNDGRSGQALLCPAAWTRISASLDLTRRESEVVLAALDDLSESDIAEKLGISRHTVHAHLKRLYRKLGIGSRAQLVARVWAEYVALASETQCIAAARRCPWRIAPHWSSACTGGA